MQSRATALQRAVRCWLPALCDQTNRAMHFSANLFGGSHGSLRCARAHRIQIAACHVQQMWSPTLEFSHGDTLSLILVHGHMIGDASGLRTSSGSADHARVASSSCCRADGTPPVPYPGPASATSEPDRSSHKRQSVQRAPKKSKLLARQI